MKNLKKISFILMIILGFLLVVYGIYNLTLSNKSRMLNALDKYLEKYVDKEDKDDQRSFKIDTDNSIVTIDNNTNLSEKLTGEMYFDSKNDKNYIKLLYSLSNVNLNFELFNTKNTIYFKLKEIKDVFYKLNIDTNKEKIDSKKLKNSFIKALRDNLNETDFEKEDANIKINGTNLETTKYSVNITSKSFKTILKDLKKEYEIDDSIFDDLSLKTDKNSDNIKLFTYSIYVTGNKNVVKNEIIIPVQLDNNEKIDALISLDDYEKNKLNYKKLYMSFDSMGTLNFELKETSEDNYLITGNIKYNNQNYKISGSINETKMNIDCYYNQKKIAGLLVENNMIEEDKKYNINITLEIENTIKIISNNKVTLDVELPNIDTSNYLDYNNMNDSEKASFENFKNLFIN